MANIGSIDIGSSFSTSGLAKGIKQAQSMLSGFAGTLSGAASAFTTREFNRAEGNMAKKTAAAKAIHKEQRQMDAAREKLDKVLQESGLGKIFSGSLQSGKIYCNLAGGKTGATPGSVSFKQGADGTWSMKFELYDWVTKKIDACIPLKSLAPKEAKAAPKKAAPKKTTKPTLKLIEGPVASHGVDNG